MEKMDKNRFGWICDGFCGMKELAVKKSWMQCENIKMGM